MAGSIYLCCKDCDKKSLTNLERAWFIADEHFKAEPAFALEN